MSGGGGGMETAISNLRTVATGMTAKSNTNASSSTSGPLPVDWNSTYGFKKTPVSTQQQQQQQYETVPQQATSLYNETAPYNPFIEQSGLRRRNVAGARRASDDDDYDAEAACLYDDEEGSASQPVQSIYLYDAAVCSDEPSAFRMTSMSSSSAQSFSVNK